MRQFKKLYLYILCIFALSTILHSASGSEIHLDDAEKAFLKQNPVITVHNEKNYPPYNFNKNGTPMGLSIDYMNLLAKKIGIKVKYVSGYEWSDFMQMMRNGKLDVMLNIRRTPKRDEFLNFTEPYAATNKAIFTNSPFLKNLKNLKGKSVCVPRDFYIDYFLEAYYPDIILIRGASLLDCMRSVVKGSSDATVGSHAIMSYLMKENNISIEHEVIIPDRRLAVGLSIATASHLELLRSLLQKAMYSINDEELSVLMSGWLGYVNAHHKLDTKSIVKPYKQKRIVTMCNNPNWAPIEFAHRGDQSIMQGIAIDTLSLIEKKLNVEFKTIPTKNWKQSQEFLEKRKCEVLPAAIETERRKKYANFTVPYLVYKLAVITKNDKPFIEGLGDIADKTIARKRGSGLISKLQKVYPQINIIETKDYKSSLKKVSEGEAYCTIVTLPVASYYINKFALKNLYIAGYLDMRYRLSMAVSKGDKDLLERMDAALSEITDYQYKEIHNKWVGSKKLAQSQDYRYFWYLLSAVIAILFLILYRQHILKGANKNLQKEVQDKVHENLIQYQSMQEQAKMAAMGEMIGVIAHQWRQPLNALGLSIQNLEFNHKDNLLNQEFIEKYIDKNLKTIKFMSQTIDDFRGFFKVDKVKESFSVRESIDATFSMQSLYLEKYDIAFEINGNDFDINGFKSEFQQVILSLISNAKDALVTLRSKDRKIEVSLEDRVIVFTDNGGGVQEKFQDKIFDSYFTTKRDGIGIGLYMSRIIIEEKLGGKISMVSHDGITSIVLDFKGL